MWRQTPIRCYIHTCDIDLYKLHHINTEVTLSPDIVVVSVWKAFKFHSSFDFKVIVDIIFVIGVNPMAQSSQSMLYNSKLMMCQTMQGTPSLSGSVGFGFAGSKLKYNQFLYHYCYMDPEEARALFPFYILFHLMLSSSGL